jgi:formate C-acetyltransferase
MRIVKQETTRRLSSLTHQLAQRGLSGEFGRGLVPADWDFPAGRDGSLSPAARYAQAALSVAEHAPLRILLGELIVGSATLKEAPASRVPLLNTSSNSHTTVGFGKVLNTGYRGLRVEITERLRKGGLDKQGMDLLDAMLKTLDAAGLWQERNIALVNSQREAAPPEDQPYYDELIQTLRNVPENKPLNFREALQSLWSMYAFQRLMGNWSGLGRIDQMLYPFLKKDLDEKHITLDEARELIAHFWIKGTEWITGEQVYSGDAQFYQNVILGGIDRDGNEVTNDISYLVLDVIEELHISDYPVAVRINHNSPEKMFRRIAEVQRRGGGIVSVYNEEVVIKGLVDFGYPLEEAREYTNDGCWETIIPGKTAFGYSPFDMTDSLSRALYLDKKTRPNYADFDSLYSAFITELETDITKLQNTIDGWRRDAEKPNPLISMFVEGCIEKGRGFNNRGPKYTVQAIHAGGMADTANGLYTLKKLVFDEKSTGLDDFITVLRGNWEGSEELRQTVKNRLTYYGNNAAESDEMMCRVFNDYSAIIGRIKERSGVKRPCGISTFGREIDWRMKRKAGPAGSRIGDILATNCSPSPGTDKKGPTAVLNSYCKLDFTRSCNGATVELKVLPSSVKNENGINALIALSKVFLDKKGFYMNIDVVDTSMLIDAQKHPERYPNLPVRISGWSARFTTLSREWQDMIIQRTQQMV